MDIKSSLVIQNQYVNKINLIESGSFVRVYNQSFYLLTQIIGRQLKPLMRYVKSADNCFVVYGGFPAHKVMSDYPQAIKTEWGYQLADNFDTKGYMDWLLQHKAMAQATANVETAVEPSCTQSVQGGETKKNASNYIIPSSNRYILPLSEQQAHYLANWQKGAYPIEVDLGFIESLQLLMH